MTSTLPGIRMPSVPPVPPVLDDNECDTCFKTVLDTDDTHTKCVGCEAAFVCCKSGVCMLCAWKHPFHFITDHVAVGSRSSEYDLFDIVIDMNSPQNGTVEGDLKLDKQKRPGRTPLFILKCGIQDCELEGYQGYALAMFDAIHRFLGKFNVFDYSYKILFHCYAGVSRSASAAIYHLAKVTNISTTEAYQMVKEKRKWIKPNKGFLQTLCVNVSKI